MAGWKAKDATGPSWRPCDAWWQNVREIQRPRLKKSKTSRRQQKEKGSYKRRREKGKKESGI